MGGGTTAGAEVNRNFITYVLVAFLKAPYLVPWGRGSILHSSPSMMNAMITHKTIPMIDTVTHKLHVSFKLASLSYRLRIIIVKDN